MLTSERIEIHVQTNAALLLGAPGASQRAERERVRKALGAELDRILLGPNDVVGIGLTFGASSIASEGNRIAAAVNEILRESFPLQFGRAVLEQFHYVTDNPAEHGAVDIWIYTMVQ